jgi:hypothetical protein
MLVLVGVFRFTLKQVKVSPRSLFNSQIRTNFRVPFSASESAGDQYGRSLCYRGRATISGTPTSESAGDQYGRSLCYRGRATISSTPTSEHAQPDVE